MTPPSPSAPAGLSSRPGGPADAQRASAGRSWARWNSGAGLRYTVGVEEEVMLLDARRLLPAPCSARIRDALPGDMAQHVSLETHAAVLELATGVHGGVRGAAREVGALRRRLAGELRRHALVAASTGMHPFAGPARVRLSQTPRYRAVADSMRWLARRDPTLALHVHVGVPDPEDAIRAFNRLREELPVLIALAANSPYRHGEDSGFASTRAAVFGGFPRTGPPRAFAGYDDYVDAVDPLIATGALPDPTFLWWDVRLQPGLGTVELRALDAQTTIAETAALVALVVSLARHELQDGEPRRAPSPEVLAENCFLAARDGIDARLVDAGARALVPVRRRAEDLLDACRPHAAALRCVPELEDAHDLAHLNGAARQRRWRAAGGDLRSLPAALAARFAPGSRASDPPN